MSRIGNNPITIPNGVLIDVSKDSVKVTGPKGILEMSVDPLIEIKTEEGKVLVGRKKEDKKGRSIHGLYRSLLNNMVIGVSEGWDKQLEMVGVGYRAAGGGDNITLNVGFSHPVTVQAPPGITFAVTENTKIQVTGIDKILVGQVAANVRAVKPPEVYKGKGIRYVGEYIKRKAGKAGKAATGAK